MGARGYATMRSVKVRLDRLESRVPSDVGRGHGVLTYPYGVDVAEWLAGQHPGDYMVCPEIPSKAVWNALAREQQLRAGGTQLG